MTQALINAAQVVVNQAQTESLSPLMYAAVAGLESQLRVLANSDLPPTPPPFIPNVATQRLEVAQPTPTPVTLSSDQSQAWEKLQRWVRSDKPYFVLRGYAGTGKTFLMKLLAGLSGVNVYYTAPTNKAAKVLSSAVGKAAKTTYSFLGLRLVAEEDKRVLDFSRDRPYIPEGSVIVVDEASMVNRELRAFLLRVQQENRCKILFVGDPAQLPPIGERISTCWKVTGDADCRAVLKHVMRNDNQLLALSMAVRKCLKTKTWNSPLRNDNDGRDKGVFFTSQAGFRKSLLETELEEFDGTKIIAWRNKTVDAYNKLIRQHFGFGEEYCTGDRLLLASPIEEGGQIIAHTDEEFVVTEIDEGTYTVDDIKIPVYNINVTGDQTLSLRVPINTVKLDMLLARKSHAARRATGGQRTRLWKEFWNVKAQFHDVRYGYAMTAHRAQGTTLKAVYIDQHDILANSNQPEAFRCLYVGVTRPTDYLVSF